MFTDAVLFHFPVWKPLLPTHAKGSNARILVLLDSVVKAILLISRDQ
jgi:hypothetical protein